MRANADAAVRHDKLLGLELEDAFGSPKAAKPSFEPELKGPFSTR
jgi:hypothetical protein